MKRIKKVILLLLILFLTGCRVEYNLTIKGDTYMEKVSIIGENNTEINELNDSWSVPIDKNDYGIGSDDAEIFPDDIKTYAYDFSGNTLTFNNSFTENEILTSTAISNCYNSLNVTYYDGTTVISTSPNAICFDKYPDIKSVTINITVDRNVISSNADIVDKNTYIWRLNSQNAASKSVDMVIDDNSQSNEDVIIPNDDNNNDNSLFLDKDMYIFALILLIVLLLAYFIINGIKNKEDDMDD